jgi:BMFP domain-containing protein YqiC
MDKVLEKVDAIAVSNESKIEAVKAEVATTVESAKAELTEKFAALEAKVSAIQIPEYIRTPHKTVRGDVNRRVREQLASSYERFTIVLEALDASVSGGGVSARGSAQNFCFAGSIIVGSTLLNTAFNEATV